MVMPLGMELRKEEAIAIYEEMRQELMDGIQAVAKARALPKSNEGFRTWESRREKKLAAIEWALDQLKKLPPKALVGQSE